MKSTNYIDCMLQFIERPAFVVQNNEIRQVNHAAESCNITVGTRLEIMLPDGYNAYEAFTEGTLFLDIHTANNVYHASVEKLGDFDLFVLDLPEGYAELRALSLASVWLRAPLTGLINCIDDNNHTAKRMISQIHRTVNNMSDACRYLDNRKKHMYMQEISAFVGSVVENAAAKTESIGVAISFTGLPATLNMLVDEELLERAILNMISNSIKSGATQINIRLSQQTKTVSMTVQDNGKGIPSERQEQMFHAYKRTPSLKDGEAGIGLGMVIIRAAAHAHQGTVLMEHKADTGLKITMTLSIMTSTGMLRSPAMRFDYNGYEDHVLTELSDVLDDLQY